MPEPLATQETPEPSMSAEILQQLVEDHATDHQELRRLLRIGRSTVYDYLGHRDLRWPQVLGLAHHAKDDRVREALFAELAGPTSYLFMKVDARLDLDGDGDVDDDDAVKGLARMMELTAVTLRASLENKDREAGRREIEEVIREAVAVRNILTYLEDRRKKCRPAVIGGGG